MVKNKDESKECKEKTLKDKKNKGYKEPKDPLTEKAPRHQAAALEGKDVISDDVAISPAVKDKAEKEEDTLDQEAAEVKDKEQLEESVILRYKDSEKFLEAAFDYDANMPLDYDEDSFIVGVPKEEVEAFRNFMKEKGIEPTFRTSNTFGIEFSTNVLIYKQIRFENILNSLNSIPFVPSAECGLVHLTLYT